MPAYTHMIQFRNLAGRLGWEWARNEKDADIIVRRLMSLSYVRREKSTAGRDLDVNEFVVRAL